MPKLKPLLPSQQRADALRLAIKIHALQMGMETDTKAAEFLGLSKQTYRYRLQNSSAWTYEELYRVFKKLHFKHDEIQELFN